MDTDDMDYEVGADWPQRKAALPADALTEIIDNCLTQATGEFRARKKYGISVLELEDLLLDHSVERCPSCRLHMESFALVNDRGMVDGKCTNCRI